MPNSIGRKKNIGRSNYASRERRQPTTTKEKVNLTSRERRGEERHARVS